MLRLWLTGLMALGAAAAVADESVILRHRYAYPESDDGRIVARIDVTISRSESGIAVVLTVGCRGNQIEPALGGEGVRGENLVTAAELATLLTPARHRVSSVRLDDADSQPLHGVFADALRAPLVRRVFGERAGSFEERKESAHIVELRCRLTHPDRPGRVRTTVEVLGKVRLVIAWRTDGEGGARLDWIGQPARAQVARRVGE